MVKNSLDLLKKLEHFSVPELCDGLDVCNMMDYTIKPMVTREKIVGYAKTINVPIGEGGYIADVLPSVKENEVIVIAGKGNCNSSYWGDYRSLCAKLLGAKGVVIDGGFRDIDACEEIGFPIYAKGVTGVTALKTSKGESDVTISCGGALVNPKDIIVGDRNGVIVIPPTKVHEVIEKATKKIAAQNYTIEKMKKTGKVITKIIKEENK